MNQFKCHQHNTNKDFILCLDSDCLNDRLACISCVIRSGRHRNHRFVIIEHLLNDEEQEQKIMFHDQVIQMNKRGEKINAILDKFDRKMDGLLVNRKNQLDMLVQNTLDQSEKMVKQLREQLVDMLDPETARDVEQIMQDIKYLISDHDCERDQQQVIQDIDNCNELAQKSNSLLKMMQQIDRQYQSDIQEVKEVLQRQKDREQEMGQKMIRVIKQSQNNKVKYDEKLKELKLDSMNSYNQFRDLSMRYENECQPYQVFLNLGQPTTNDQKMEMIDRLDQMYLNPKVTKLELEFKPNSPISIDVVKAIKSKFGNIQNMRIFHYNDMIDFDIMKVLQQFVEELNLCKFELWFGGKNQDDEQSLKMIRRFNAIISKHSNLRCIRYYHRKLERVSHNRDETQQMINEINNM